MHHQNALFRTKIHFGSEEQPVINSPEIPRLILVYGMDPSIFAAPSYPPSPAGAGWLQRCLWVSNYFLFSSDIYTNKQLNRRQSYVVVDAEHSSKVSQSRGPVTSACVTDHLHLVVDWPRWVGTGWWRWRLDTTLTTTGACTSSLQRRRTYWRILRATVYNGSPMSTCNYCKRWSPVLDIALLYFVTYFSSYLSPQWLQCRTQSHSDQAWRLKRVGRLFYNIHVPGTPRHETSTFHHGLECIMHCYTHIKHFRPR